MFWGVLDFEGFRIEFGSIFLQFRIFNNKELIGEFEPLTTLNTPMMS